MLTSSQAVRCSTRLRASQADSAIHQVDGKVSLVNSNSSQAVRWSTRCNASQADSTISQVDSSVSQASRSSSPHSQATSNAGYQEAGASPPTSNNNRQAGSRSGRGKRHLARLFQASQENSATHQSISATSQGGITSPQ